jgi:hypothetical protein
LEDVLPGWDYASELIFELQPSFDLEMIGAQTGLSDPRLMDVVLLADCSATGARFSTSRQLMDVLQSDSNLITLEPTSGEFADSIRLSAHLALNRTVAVDDSQFRVGSRLAWSDVLTVRLEGDSPRFPTEAVPFSALSLDDAAWTLQISFTDLHESFMGGVRLLINTEHPAADSLLDPTTPGWSVTQSVLRTDIARQLIVHVAFEEFDLSEHTWPEDSVRDVLENLTDLFLGSDLASTARLARSDYARFERRLQSRFDLLRGSA